MNPQIFNYTKAAQAILVQSEVELNLRRGVPNSGESTKALDNTWTDDQALSYLLNFQKDILSVIQSMPLPKPPKPVPQPSSSSSSTAKKRK